MEQKADKKEYDSIIHNFNGKFDVTFKMILIGDSGVGKTCITQNAIKDVFDTTYMSTVGFEFSSIHVNVNNKIVKLQLWDTCGQEIYHSLISNFYRNAVLAIMVYSIDCVQSFESISKWLNEIKINSSPDVRMFLIGNKVDLEDRREVSFEKGEQFALKNGINLFMESSARDSVNSKKVFIEAAKLLLEDHLKYNIDVSVYNSLI